MTGIEDIKSLVADGASFIDAATLGAETPKSVSFADLSDVFDCSFCTWLWAECF